MVIADENPDFIGVFAILYGKMQRQSRGSVWHGSCLQRGEAPMKENRKLLKEVLKDIRRDMSDEEVLNLLADSKISVKPETEKDKYTLGQRAADAIAKFAGS